MRQEGATLSAILDTRNESAVNDSSFPPLSAFVSPRYTVSLIRTAATGARLGSSLPLFYPSFPPLFRGGQLFLGRLIVSSSPFIDE